MIYDPEARGHCPGCGTGLGAGEACPWPDCPRCGLLAGDDRSGPRRHPGRVTPISRDEAAHMIYEQTAGNMAAAMVPYHGELKAPARTMTGEAALAALERRVQLDAQEAYGAVIDIEIRHS